MQRRHSSEEVLERPIVKERTPPKIRMRRKKGSIDLVFLLIILVLLAFGVVMVFSASYASSYAKYGDSLYTIRKHLIYVVAGIAIMIFLAKFPPYFSYERLALFIYIVALGLMAIVVISNGFKAGRWLYIGGMSIQPSEVMKFAMIVVCSALVSKNHDQMHKMKYGVVPFALALIPVIALMMIQHHLSGTIIICGIVLVMMFVGGTRLYWFIILVVLGGAGLAGIVLWKGVEYMQDRVRIWLDPFSDLLGDSWQTVQSMVAIGSGGVMGLGLGNSRQKYLYLPEPQNDFIFAIVCEELGMIGAILVILLFIFLIYRGFAIANKAPNKFAAMMVIGITVQIAIQAMLNIAVVTNSIPNTGISLPFFSYGGTALTMQLAEVGIILNISRYSLEEKT